MTCECGGKLRPTHAYATPNGKTQRLECEKCGVIATAIVAIVNTNPERGEGAYALAKKLRKHDVQPV